MKLQYGWVVVAAGALMGCVAIGTVFSLAVFLQPMSDALLLGLGLALASRTTSLLEFQLVYGIMVGGAAGAVFAPTIATVTGWFDKHRSLAVSLVSAGMGVAPMTISPFASWLIQTYDWRTAQ